MGKATTWRLGVAIVSLTAAIAVYCFAREQPPALLESWQTTIPALTAQAAVFANLPSLLYTLAIGLLIGSCAATTAAARWHCLLWLVIALSLELGQHRLVAEPLTGWLPDRVGETAWQIIGPYWANGSFDSLDLLATFAGGIIALLFFAVAQGNYRHEALT